MNYRRSIILITLLILIVAPSQTLLSKPLSQSRDIRITTIEEMSAEQWQHLVPKTARTNTVDDFRFSSKLKTIEFYVLTIENNGSRSYWNLELTKQLEQVSLYYIYNDRWTGMVSGDQVPVKNRPHYSSLLILPVHLEPYSTTKLFVKACDYQIKHPGFTLHTPEETAAVIEKRTALLFFVYSCMFIALLFNLVLFFHKSNQAHLYYSITMLALLIALLGKHRLLSSLFLPAFPYGYFGYIFFNSAAAASALLFCIYFFRIDRRSRLRYFMMALVTVFTIIAAAAFVFPEPLVGDIMNAAIVPALALILYITLKRGIQDSLPSRIVLLSLAPICLVYIADNLLLYFSIPQPEGFPLIQAIGIVIHILLINYGLIMRQTEMNRAYTTLLNKFEERVMNEVKARTIELENHANTDPLTHVLNRKFLEEKITFLEEKNERAQKIGIVFIDIDNFKQFNDEFGHKTGDLILKRTALFLQKNTRDGDSVFRYGGDEFLILMPGADDSLVRILGERLLINYVWITKPITDSMPAFPHRISLSIGGCCWSKESPHSLRDAVDCADSALLKAKKEGKSKMVYLR